MLRESIARSMGNSRHILILEESWHDADIVQRLLSKSMKNLIFSLARNKPEFIELVDKLSPDVILADNSLPGFNAMEALLLVSKRLTRIPFILVTGAVSEEFAAAIIKMGADDYILKHRLERLPAAIDDAIKQIKDEKDRLKNYTMLIQNEERYRKMVGRITDAFITLDTNWRFTYVNEQAAALTGRNPQQLIGKLIWDEFPEITSSAVYNDFFRAMREQRYITNVDYFAPRDLWQEYHIYPSPDGISVFTRDITVRKQAEKEILEKNTELHQLSSHLQNEREEQSIHISQVIHDELGQQLAALKMDMRWLQKKLVDSEDSVRDKIKDVVNVIDETAVSARRIVSELRPCMLDDLGLVASLQWHGMEVQKKSGLNVSFNSSVEQIDIPIETTTGIFRIYQDVLTNVMVQEDVTEVTSKLELSGNLLKLFVSDNGKGNAVNSASAKSPAWSGVKERTHVLGGCLEFSSQVKEGTEVQVTIPI